MAKQCCIRVFSGQRYDISGHMCGKPGAIERDGKLYCKFHDPQVVEKRKARQQEKWDAEWKASRDKYARQDLAWKALVYLERTQPDWESRA